MKCGICGKEDLFSAVTQQPACSLCVVGFGLRTPVTQQAVDHIRQVLGLKPGEYRPVDQRAEASTILGRNTP